MLNRHFTLCAAVLSIFVSAHSWAIITSDFPGTHIVPTGGHFNGADLDGVVLLELEGEDIFGNPGSIFGSGAVLQAGPSSQWLLTAAHVIEPAKVTAPQSTFFVDRVKVHYNFGDPSATTEQINSGAFGGQLLMHPDYKPAVTQPANGVHSGFDVALIKVNNVPANITGYLPDPTSKNFVMGDPFGHIVAGRGTWGFGATGFAGISGLDGLNRAGFNRYESDQIEGLLSEFLINTFSNEDTMIAFDFEEPGNGPATSYYDDFDTVGFGLDEVTIAPGDSGGPTFENSPFNPPNIIGVHSFGASFEGTDVFPGTNSSWGEVGVDAWVGHPEIFNWIRLIASQRRGWIGLPFNQPSGPSPPSLTDGANWFGGVTPTSAENAEIAIGGSRTIVGPGTGQVFEAKSLFIGGSDGVKTVILDGGGTVNVAQDLTIDTNGFVQLIHDTLIVDRLVVQGLTPTVNPFFGTFAQFDDGSPGPASSLTANEIVVEAGGDFSFLTDTGTLSAPVLDVRFNGNAFLGRDVAFGMSVTNAGLIDLGSSVAGNVLTVGTGGYTQTVDGVVGFEIGGAAAGMYDQLTVTGPASLAGEIKAFLSAGFSPQHGDSFDLITANSLSGTFDAQDLPPLTGGLMWNLIYNATDFTLGVVGILLGDANNDGQVTGADLIAVQQNFGNVGNADGLLLGDANDDGQVTGADLISVQQNFGNVFTPGSAPTAVPEPGTMGFLLLGLCGLLRRGRRMGTAHHGLDETGGGRCPPYRKECLAMRRRLGSIVLASVIVLSGTRTGAATGTADFLFNETTPGTWDVLANVTGDTSGLAGFAIDIFADPAQVTWTSNTLSVITSMDPFTIAGFTTDASGDVGSGADAFYSIGSGQNMTDAIFDIGMSAVYVESAIPGTIPPVDLDVPALLGTITAPTGLTTADFGVTASLYDATRTPKGFLAAADTIVLLGGQQQAAQSSAPPPEASTGEFGLGGDDNYSFGYGTAWVLDEDGNLVERTVVLPAPRRHDAWLDRHVLSSDNKISQPWISALDADAPAPEPASAALLLLGLALLARRVESRA